MGSGKGRTRRMRAEGGRTKRSQPSPGAQPLAFADLEGTAQMLRDEKQRFVAENKEKWQAVPWLAALADGRTGANGRDQIAYAQLAWPLRLGDASGSWNIACVDLQELRIVGLHARNELPGTTVDEIRLSELDVDSLTQTFQNLVVEPIFSGYDEKEVSEMQFERLKRLHRSGFPMPPVAEAAVKVAFPHFPERTAAEKEMEEVDWEIEKVTF